MRGLSGYYGYFLLVKLTVLSEESALEREGITTGFTSLLISALEEIGLRDCLCAEAERNALGLRRDEITKLLSRFDSVSAELVREADAVEDAKNLRLPGAELLVVGEYGFLVVVDVVVVEVS